MCTALISSCKKRLQDRCGWCLFLFWSKSPQTKLGNSIENCYHNGLWMGKTEMLSSLIPWIGKSTTFFCHLHHKRTPNALFKAPSRWFSYPAAHWNGLGTGPNLYARVAPAAALISPARGGRLSISGLQRSGCGVRTQRAQLLSAIRTPKTPHGLLSLCIRTWRQYTLRG